MLINPTKRWCQKLEYTSETEIDVIWFCVQVGTEQLPSECQYTARDTVPYTGEAC